MPTQNCPIWASPSKFFPVTGDYFDVESARAGGRYQISGTAERIGIRSELRSRLTSWLIDQRRLGNDVPRIDTSTLSQIETQRPLDVQSRADRLLAFMVSRTPMIGMRFCCSERYLDQAQNSWIEHESFSYMKAWSESESGDDVHYLLQFLDETGHIKRAAVVAGTHTDPGTGQQRERSFEYAIRPSAYAHLDRLKENNSNSAQAFVAMWFQDSMKEAYDDGIRPGIEDAGYSAMRIDMKEHVKRIDDEIIAEIRRSRFLVADFTQGEDGARGGVYYEAGFAYGLNIPVVFTCNADSFKNVHFDTRQYNFIVWSEVSDLRQRLARRISAVMGDGPYKHIGSIE